MLRCCRRCKNTGYFVHESGWSCEKHGFFISINNLESLQRAFDCQDCQLNLNRLFEIGVKHDTISIKYKLIENSQRYNGIFTYTKQGDDSGKLYVEHPTDDLVVEYTVCFDDFPVYRTTDIEMIKLIKEGFNFQV